MVYLMMSMSLVIGFFFATGTIVGMSESVLYTAGVLVERSLWGLILMITSAIAIYGFLVGNDSLISLGGIAGFTAWVFASIALAMTAHWYVFITIGLLHMLFHVYVVLASATNALRRPRV